MRPCETIGDAFTASPESRSFRYDFDVVSVRLEHIPLPVARDRVNLAVRNERRRALIARAAHHASEFLLGDDFAGLRIECP